MTLLPIGQFARASRLSVKSLRNYDQSGLLPAAVVDPQSGYRYYRLEQLARADAIRSLRMADMPLDRIAETLDADDPDGLLRSHLVELENQRDELERKAQQLRRRIATKEFVMSTDVTIKTNPELVAIGHRTATTHLSVFDDIPAGFGTVMAALAESDIDPVGAPFTIFHRPPDGDTDGDIAMCIPIAGPVDNQSLAGHSLSTVVVPADPAASIVHRGDYGEMGATYATVAAWIRERGHRITGPTREIYLNSPADVADEDLLTELLFPIDADGEASA